MQEQRLRIISFMQCLGITCVVLGHSFAGQPDHPVRQWLTSFEMPLFMAISGCLAAYTLGRRGQRLGEIKLWGKGGYLTRKVRRLLLPYVVLSTIVFPLKALMSRWALRPVEFTLASYLHQLLCPVDNVVAFLWFLPALFLIFCIWCYGARLKIRGLSPAWVLLPLSVYTAFDPLCWVKALCIGRALQYLFFFGVGYFGLSVLQKIRHNRHCISILIVALVLSFVLLAIPYSGLRFEITAINGMIMCMAAGALYECRDAHWLDWMDGSTYAIYLLSWFPQTAAQQLAGSLLGLPWQVCTVLAFAGGVLLPWLIWRYVLKPNNIKL